MKLQGNSGKISLVSTNLTNYRIAILLIIILGLLGWHIQDSFPKNLIVICLLRELNSNHTVKDSECLNEQEWEYWIPKSLTINSLYTLGQLESGKGIEKATPDTTICSYSLGIWKNIDHTDPRKRLVVYQIVLTLNDKIGDLLPLGDCKDLLPSSTFMFFDYLHFRDLGEQSKSADILELAYITDHGWTKPRYRGIVSYRQGEAYQHAGQFDQAAEAYERAITSFTDEIYYERDLYLSLSNQGLGELAVKKSRYSDAIIFFEESIILFPNRAPQIAESYLDALYQSDITNVEEHLRNFILGRGESNPVVTSALIIALTQRNENETAERLFSKIPSNNDPYLLAAQSAVLAGQENWDDSTIILEQAITQISQTDQKIASEWSDRLALLWEEQGNIPEAILAVEKAVSYFPEQKRYWYNLARLYHKNKDDQNAERAIIQALELDPENVSYIDFYHQLLREP